MGCGRCRGSGWLLHTDAVGGERCRSSGAERVPCGCEAGGAPAGQPACPTCAGRGWVLLAEANGAEPRPGAGGDSGRRPCPGCVVGTLPRPSPALDLDGLRDRVAAVLAAWAADPAGFDPASFSPPLAPAGLDPIRASLQRGLGDFGGDAVRRRPHRPFGFGDR